MISDSLSGEGSTTCQNKPIFRAFSNTEAWGKRKEYEYQQ